MTPEEKVRAAKAFSLMKEGFGAFESKDYGQAIVKWRESFDAYPTAIVQLNIARAYMELEDFEAAHLALKVARGDTETTLSVPLTQLDRIELEELELEINKREDEAKARQEAKILEDKKKACSAEATRFGPLGKTGVGVGGAGLLSLGGTIFFATRARSELSALQPPHTKGEDAYNSQARAFQTSQKRARITLGIGASLLLVGGGLAAYDFSTVDYASTECDALMKEGASTRLHGPRPRTARVVVGPGTVVWRF
jgi:hypothetical protein